MELSKAFLERLQKAYSVVVLSGAGVSAASNIPTFRGKDGLWNKYNPQQLATMRAFKAKPKLVWEWYQWRRKLISEAQPNPAHISLVSFEKYFHDFQIITQNVDGLHHRAGSQKITEIHGNIMLDKCINCEYKVAADIALIELRKCPNCDHYMRPNVVWFGENLPEDALELAKEKSVSAEIVFSIGTSGLVDPAASLPFLAKGNGAMIIEVNPEKTPLTDIADVCFPFPVEKFMPALLKIIEKLRKPLN